MNRLFIALFVLSIVAALASVVPAKLDGLPALSKADTEAYNRLVWITGHVRWLNHRELGATPAHGTVLTFQSKEHRDIVVATRTDLDGRYELFLSPGSYRLIVPELDGDRTGLVDTLPPSQLRELIVRANPSGLKFDIDLVLPMTPKCVTPKQ